MDSATRSLIEQAPLVITDFDGTLARLAVDWPALKEQLLVTARRLKMPWSRDRGLDENLYPLRAAGEEMAFRVLCTLLARAEVQGFSAEQVNLSFASLLYSRRERPLGVCSANTHQALVHALGSPLLSRLQPMVIGKEDVWQGKPAPEGLLRICRHYGCIGDDAVFVGDSPNDQAAAEAAGVRYIPISAISPLPPRAADRQPRVVNPHLAGRNRPSTAAPEGPLSDN